MDSKHLLQEASLLQETIVTHRRFLHANPEVGFDLEKTYQYVYDRLVEMGYSPNAYGKCGLIASVDHISSDNNGVQTPTILLRADMDALSIREETNLDYQSTNGNMHACGHDMHTAMLLGAARLLKNHEKEIKGRIVLCFQPAEELLAGAKDMIDAGVLRDTHPDAALMIHVTVGMPFETGTVVVCDGGVSAPAADYFFIHIQGKGCHGAMPQLGIDPITVAAHIIIGLQELHAREISMSDDSMLTIGSIHAGDAANVIPDSALLQGSIRAYDEEVRIFLKTRMEDIISHIASAFRADATLEFTSGCPTLYNDEALSQSISGYMKELLGPSKAFTKAELTSLATSDDNSDNRASKATGSEDFAYFSQQVPSIMLAMAAGNAKTGCNHPLHHPEVCFDESALSIGSAVYAYNALRWLEEKNK